MLAPLARPGARLPGLGDEPLGARTIRGVRSDGMLCSARELGLGDDHEGIVDLGGAVEPGADVREALGLDDTVFDLSITPNRPDAMSIVGVARELAAHFELPLTIDAPTPQPNVDRVDGATVTVDAPERCPRLTARVARIAMGESPAFLQRRLRLAGMRPISNVVDVTNYVMLERGRPLHAFDLDKMGGRGILVRLAADGETITTLDGVERSLLASDLLICDAGGTPQAIAGVMGGASAEVSSTTTEIILESAYFEPRGIARTSKRLGLRSEASARFERGVDPESTVPGADIAMALLEQVASAAVAAGTVDVYPTPVERPRITVRTSRANAILGTDIPTERLRSFLPPLGIEIEEQDSSGSDDHDTFVAIPPSFRPDLEREIDVIEEVARRHGLDNIERTVPTSRRVGRLTSEQRERRLVVDVLVGAGYTEIYTLALVAPADLTRAGLTIDDVVEVENPLRAEESVLRPAVLPGLLRAVQANVAHGSPDIALFETGTVFRRRTSQSDEDQLPVWRARDAVLPEERFRLACVRSGLVGRTPHEPDRPVDPYDAVAVIEALRESLRLADLRLVNASVPSFHAARAAEVHVDGEVIGAVGQVAPDVLAAFELDRVAGTVVAVELDLDALLAATRLPEQAVEVSRYPGSNIDLAFVLPESVPAADVLATLRAAGGPVLEDVRLFDVFRSDTLGRAMTSLAFALRFRASDRTLTDEQVGALRKRCIGAVEKAHGARLRG
jgi:phenylalanyl-tRNA synthetase beta chain